MKFYDIDVYDSVVPGEFLYHSPTKAIVVCGSSDGDNVKVIYNGRVFDDAISNFKKITVTKRERSHYFVPSCKSCGG